MAVDDAAPTGGSAALTGIGQQEQAAATAAHSGLLAISPGVAERAAAICDDHKQRLADLRKHIGDLGKPVNFGDCETGRQLSAKFVDKAITGPESLDQLIAAATRIVDNLAQTYRDAGAAYQHQDQAGADALRGVAK